MVIELAAGYMVSQAVRLLFGPLAKEARDRFVADLGGRVGGGVAGIVTGWTRRLAVGSPEELEKVTIEMRKQPAASSALRGELETRLGVTLSGTGQSGAGGQPSTDEFIVDAYEATFWRIATLAAWERRPIAIDGALQGAGWLTVCVPKRHASEASVVDPQKIWDRVQPPALKRRSPASAVEFFVKRASDAQRIRSRERNKLNDGFRRDPTRDFVPDSGAPPNARWYELCGVHTTWVELYSAGANEIDWNVALKIQYGSVQYNSYPVEWQPLLDIPDEAAGLAALNRGADSFSANNQALRQAVGAIISSSSDA